MITDFSATYLLVGGKLTSYLNHSMSNIKLEKIDFDKLYDESEAAGRFGECPHCEFDHDYTPKILCWCGVCLKYHHDDYFHEMVEDFDLP